MYVATIALMQALTAAPTEEVVVGGYYTENDGGGGIFVWKKNTSIPAEDFGTVFKSTTLTDGWYQRLYIDDTVNVKWFGVNSDYVSPGIGTDCTVRIQNALDLGASLNKTVVSVEAKYLVKSGLHIKGNIDFGGATLYFEGDTIQKLLSQTVEADILNLNVDGSGVDSCEYGLYVDTNYVTTKMSRYIMRIEHIGNSDKTQSCNGAVFVKGSGLTDNLNNKYDISISCKDIAATANGTIGDSGGASTGILFSMNGVGTDAQVIIRDLEIDGCSPGEDSAGINILTGDYRNNGKGQFLIENVIVRNSIKRGIKIQAPNAIVQNATVYCDVTDIGFDTYSSDTRFIHCHALAVSTSAFYTSGKDTLIQNCTIVTNTEDSDFSLIVADTEAERLRIDNISVTLNKNFVSDLGTVIRSQAASDVFVQHVVLKTTKKIGSFISSNSANDIYVDDVVVTGLSTGILIGNNTGRIFINDSNFKTYNNCIFKIGTNMATVYTTDSLYESMNSTAINLNGTGYNAILHMNDCTVKALTHGVLPAGGSSVRNTLVQNTAGVATGVGISVQNGTVDGCRLINCLTGISWAYSTTAIITNNTAIGCSTAFESLGATTYVAYQNVAV